MTERLRDVAAAEAWCAQARARGRTLGLVPTMGALHEGHLGLVRRAARECDAAVVSVFVNPLQFDEARDFERYPRDFEGDAALLEPAGCSLVFTGTLRQFFPREAVSDTRIAPDALLDPGPSAAGLEGEFRPGHFAGVATIVARLFDVTRPTRAYFGAKDFQQSLVVADLARRRGGPEVVVCPTAREPSGLARSSRNELLGREDRERAARIHRALRTTRDAWRAGERDAERLTRVLASALADAPFAVEYAELRDPEAWSARAPRGRLERAVALVAARLSGVRLIDNLRLDREDGAP
jgi:pantoate--beta-alanine ligase